MNGFEDLKTLTLFSVAVGNLLRRQPQRFGRFRLANWLKDWLPIESGGRWRNWAKTSEMEFLRNSQI
jgi:hypothetical protein